MLSMGHRGGSRPLCRDRPRAGYNSGRPPQVLLPILPSFHGTTDQTADPASAQRFPFSQARSAIPAGFSGWGWHNLLHYRHHSWWWPADICPGDDT